MPSKQTYNLKWEGKKIHPNLSEWMIMGKDNRHFCCKRCNTGSLKLGAMIIGAPMNHMKANKGTSSIKTKHERNLDIIRSSQSISTLVPKRTENRNNSEPKQAENAVTDIQLPTCSTTQKAIIPTFSSSTSVKAEIILAMKSVTSHLSASSMEDLPEIIQYICPDSQIMKQVHLHCTKLGYIVNHGLAPYYKEKAISSVKEAAYFVSSFDESFNFESNKKQLDAHVNIFNDEFNPVEQKYIESSFIRHGDAETCLKSLIDVLGNLDYVNSLIQVGMDGPNVDWKLFDMMKQDRLEKNPKASSVLELGSCGLHVVHRAFGTAESATDWNLAKFP